jgi:predicted choloylglycine hydrolase
MKKFRKILRYTFLSLLILFIGFVIYAYFVIQTKPPKVENKSILQSQRVELGENFYGIKNCRLRKSNSGLWEIYVEGNAFERGVYNGKLATELIVKQEDAFVGEIKKIIPSPFYLNFLKYFVGWFNRDMDQYIPNEYLQEIYGISESASSKYKFIGTKYQRILNYHGAHDIGHAMQDYAMVGCTSFGAWNQASEDGSLIIGRNFDFYVGDKFAEDKIVTFYKPDNGFKFVMITWGGFIGVVSGMNERGLTVTLNAAKSDIPTSAADPISLLAREILQYSENIEQAFEIAKKRQIFVSEAILIGSGSENRAAIIEKSPMQTSLYTPDGDRIIGPNHFQSPEFVDNKLNIKNITESSSMYRFKRIKQLLDKNPKMNYLKAAAILRDQHGIDEAEIGMTNEKNICQLISHHSVIFKPREHLFWISTAPYQMGQYVCYNLDSVFNVFPGMEKNREIHIDSLTIPADSFLYSEGYQDFLKYKELKSEIKKEIKNKANKPIDENIVKQFIASNPEYYLVYSLSGDYYFAKNRKKEAAEFYKTALTKEITTVPERIEIEKKILKCVN